MKSQEIIKKLSEAERYFHFRRDVHKFHSDVRKIIREYLEEGVDKKG